MFEERCVIKRETITVVSLLLINLVIHCHCVALRNCVFLTLINKKTRQQRRSSTEGRPRQILISTIKRYRILQKRKKTNTKLHQTETAIRIGNFPNVKRKDERKALSDGDCDTNMEFPIVKRKDERKAPLDGDCDTNREFRIVIIQ